MGLGENLSAQLQYNWNDKSQQIYDAITSLRIPEARKWLEQHNITFEFIDYRTDVGFIDAPSVGG